MRTYRLFCTQLLLMVLLIISAACTGAQPGDDPGVTPDNPTMPAATQTSAPEIIPTPTEAIAVTVEPTPTSEVTEPTPDLEALRQAIASRLEVSVDNVSIDSIERLLYPDLCLGVYDGGNCYRAVLQIEGNTSTFHVNDSGNFTNVVETVPAQSGQIVLTFGRDDCMVGALRREAPPVGIGPCASEFSSYAYGADSATAANDLQEQLNTFAPFTAVTTSGFLSFGGSGSEQPDAQQQEDIAAWVRDVLADALAEGPVEDALCLRLGRPAIVTQNQGAFALTNPLSGETCPLTLPGEWHGALQAAGGRLYYQDTEGEDILIRELSADGSQRALEATRINSSQYSLLGFTLSADGNAIAWSTAALSGQPGMTTSLFMAQTDSDVAQPLITDLFREDGRGLIPLRFDERSQVLIYTLQPIGIGGSWISFVGRYDNLYQIPASGGEGQQRFDCAALDLFLCVGDFRLHEGELVTIAYIRESNVEVIDGQGAAISSITMDAEYVAYPTFNAEAELVFYTATIGEGQGGSPFALPGAYYRIGAPYRAEPGLIAEQDGLLTPYQWFDARHLIIGFGDVQGNWGSALLSFDGAIQPLDPWPMAQPVAVMR